MKKELSIHPLVRLFFLICGVLGAVYIKPEYLLIYYTTILIPFLVVGGLLKRHLSFLLFGTIPIFLSFVLLYIVVQEGAQGSWGFIVERIIRISVAAFVFQTGLSVPPDSLIRTFKAWGLKGEFLLIGLGIFVISDDMTRTANRIITARFAGGHVGKRNFVNTARQFPLLLVPLVVGMIRSSLDRSESWNQKHILQLIDATESPKVRYSVFWNSLLLSGSIVIIILILLQIINRIS